jgi:glyoxylase-like metal-dependent hydrolase (beta-lactamase superfamily II)
MTTVDVLHVGYTGDRVGSTVVLVRDGDATIVVDPGLVRTRSLILDPLTVRGVAPEAVTHVFVSHHHLDHTLNIALFPNAEVIDFESRFRDDQWLDHDGDGYRISPRATVWQTPGHTEQDASLIVEADDGLYAMTHCWWHTDQTPEIDPFCRDPAVLARSRQRILDATDVVVPGHGEPFRLRP